MQRHKPIFRIQPNADIAVLFIHGIVGTPDHFHKFIPLVPENWSIYNVLLDGHGGSVTDFAKTSMSRWKEQIDEIVTMLLENHKEIIIVAHSMGTLFAIQTAIKYPQRVRHLFLLAAPLRIHPKPIAAITSLKVLFNKIAPNDRATLGAKRAYGIDIDTNLFKYLSWIPRYTELLKEIPCTRSLAEQIQVPCTVYQSKKDELVSFSSVELFKSNPNIEVIPLPKSGHFYLKPCEEQRVLRDFQKLCIK